jgi:hypothetical protein
MRNGACYVNVGQAPLTLWRAYKKGSMARLDETHRSLFKDKVLRLGSYGDPAAAPIELWDKLTSWSKAWLGYTENWRHGEQALRKYCMASVHTPTELELAKSLGWKTFRVKLPEEIIDSNEFICPKSKPEDSPGYRQCFECKACRGGEWTGHATPVIDVHGWDYRKNRFKEYRLSLA